MPRRGVLFYLPVCNWGYVNAYDASKIDNFGAGGSIRDCLCSVSVRKYIQNIGRGIYDLWLCTRLHEEAVGR